MFWLNCLFALQNIEKELLERLKRGVFGDIYNYPTVEYNKVLDKELLAADNVEEEEEVVHGFNYSIS